MKDKDNVEVVLTDTYKGYKYAITCVDGMWYCAYIVIPKDNKYYKVDYDFIPLDVHGGLTFGDYHRCLNGEWCIGWDYAHAGDYNPGLGDFQFDFFGAPAHKWTVKEIEVECKDAIDQLIKLEKRK